MIASAAPPQTPCTAPATATTLRCPDLVMGRPTQVSVQRISGRVLLHGTSRVENVGAGPLELRGRRTGARRMAVTQVIRRGGGGHVLWSTRAHLHFKAIPGQGRYWKLHDAASLEVWTLAPAGALGRQVRRGPKLDYCLRDLLRQTPPPRGAPAGRVYPGCNQNAGLRSVTLGTSVGWIDRYPSTYYEQYVDVTGLHGRFAFVMRADPNDRLIETDETNNASWVDVALR